MQEAGAAGKKEGQAVPRKLDYPSANIDPCKRVTLEIITSVSPFLPRFFFFFFFFQPSPSSRGCLHISFLLCVDKNVPYIYKQTNGSTCAVGFRGNTIITPSGPVSGQRMLSSLPPFPYHLRNFRPAFAVPSFLIFSSIRVNVLSVGASFPPPSSLLLSLSLSLSLSR